MTEHDDLAERFEEHRTHLRAVAYRMLGSLSEVDDAVQEAWLRLSRSETSGIENLGGWLTTVVGRVCLDMLRSRTSRRVVPLGEPLGTQGARDQDGGVAKMSTRAVAWLAWSLCLMNLALAAASLILALLNGQTLGW